MNGNELLKKYIRKSFKQDKPIQQKILYAETICTGIHVIKSVPDNESKLDIFHTDDEKIQNFACQYRKQLCLAHTDPEAFLYGLCHFFRSIRTPVLQQWDRFVPFYQTVLERALEDRANGTPDSGAAAYACLLLQTNYYLHNLNNQHLLFAGLSSHGETYAFPALAPYIESYYLLDFLQEKEKQELRIFLRQYPYKQDEIDVLFFLNSINRSMIQYLMPFINERMVGFLPHELFHLNADIVPCVALPDIRQDLAQREKLLPACGMSFINENSSDITMIEMKELIFNANLYLIFKISGKLGDICGFYNPKTQICCSPFSFIEDTKVQDIGWAYIETMLACYAAQTIPSAFVLPAGFHVKKRHEQAANKPIKSLFCSDTGYIKKLSAGQCCSAHARAQADNIGIKIVDGQTYVCQRHNRLIW